MASCSHRRGWWCHPGPVAPRAAKKTDSRLAARLAALASLGASVIHFAVVPNHWHEWMPAGLFFAAIALFQLLWARLVLTRTTTPVLALGIMVNLAVVALWTVSRTAGAPLGPHAGQAELIQAADLCALLLQIYVVMGAGWVWHRGLQGQPVSAFVSAMVLLGAFGVVALASTVGAASGLRHGHHAPAGAEAGPHHHGTGSEQSDDHHSHDPEQASPPSVVRPVEAPAPAPGSGGASEQATPVPISEPLPTATPLDDHQDHDHMH
ncbi:hypothetical protein [Mycolicibacterium canariasense]|uniref:hypothetical protein n=1 Tax=Mycolicibacterium canariasense TaxID=228230 RepID=UPI00078997E5|nr:hypothetical protein [Mycolicibacterium canariasense]MCV7210342.1 hypothetical protein [Mycolicibacterium canariasense]ORU97152.1 hypothetical protein AWB94_30930 [Mycolicibacterium canariasense]